MLNLLRAPSSQEFILSGKLDVAIERAGAEDEGSRLAESGAGDGVQADRERAGPVAEDQRPAPGAAGTGGSVVPGWESGGTVAARGSADRCLRREPLVAADPQHLTISRRRSALKREAVPD